MEVQRAFNSKVAGSCPAGPTQGAPALSKRTCNSDGQSSCLLSRKSWVRPPPGPLGTTWPGKPGRIPSPEQDDRESSKGRNEVSDTSNVGSNPASRTSQPSPLGPLSDNLTGLEVRTGRRFGDGGARPRTTRNGAGNGRGGARCHLSPASRLTGQCASTLQREPGQKAGAGLKKHSVSEAPPPFCLVP